MPFKDLREFIARLEEEGEAIKIEEEVNWNLEASAILRRSAEEGLPAPIFQTIKGYPQGYRLFGNSANSFRRMAISMDLKPDTHPRELIEEYLRRRQKQIKPVLVSTGPCKENVHTGDDVNLLEFPVPMQHEGDGGRYLGTWHVTIVKDPDSGWVNWGMYRHMLQSKNAVGILLASLAKHLGIIRDRSYLAKNKAMEVAIAIGVEPISAMCAASPLPVGVSEVDVVGGIRGEPVELVKCETVDLEVPATAEIIIEGELRPDDTMDEGPFGEFTGYMGGIREPRPVIRVKAVTHRNDPIFTCSCCGIPVDDNAVFSMTKAAEILELMRKEGKPVTGVFVPLVTTHMLAIVAVNKGHYPGVAEDIAHLIWASGSIGHETPYIMIVDDDVDPFNLNEVYHALITKCHPMRGIVRLEHSPVISIVPWLNREERKTRLGARAYFDCTWPLDWDLLDVPKRISFKQSYPTEVQNKALDIWRKHGYGEKK
jgi:phenylphosphate carboxylase alpha subunit